VGTGEPARGTRVASPIIQDSSAIVRSEMQHRGLSEAGCPLRKHQEFDGRIGRLLHISEQNLSSNGQRFSGLHSLPQEYLLLKSHYSH